MVTLGAAALLAAAAAMADAGLDGEQARAALLCTALNVYHEARGEPPEGQAAIAHVTLNRAAHRAFPSDPCAVVSDCSSRGCQFGWWPSPHAPRDPRAWRRALRHAAQALAGATADPSGGAVYFVRADRPTPGWARRFTETATIGAHRFLRR